MPKPMFVWSGSAWVSVASEVESLAGFATQSYADNVPGMKLIVPSSISVGSGSGSVATQGTVSFSGASSVSINDVFSTTYDKYLLQWSFSGSTSLNVLFRYRVSGSDNSTTNYYTAGLSNGWSGASTSYYNSGSGQTSWTMIPTGSSAETNGSYVISDPFVAKKTHIFGNWSRGTGGEIAITGNVFDVNTSFTGFSLITSTGTITGNVRIYGYKAG